MEGKLRNMTAIYLFRGDRVLLLYRQGGRVVSDVWTGSAGGYIAFRKTKGEIRQNYYFFADIKKHVDDNLVSNEGLCKCHESFPGNRAPHGQNLYLCRTRR